MYFLHEGLHKFLLKTFNLNPPKIGDLIEGKILEQRGASIYADLGPYGTGIIYGREYINARETIRSLRPGDPITAKVVDINPDTGYIELSLKDAGQEIIALLWLVALVAIIAPIVVSYWPVIVTALLASKTELRKQALASAKMPGFRQ